MDNAHLQHPQQHPNFPNQKALVDECLGQLTFEAVASYLLTQFSAILETMQAISTNGVINFTFLLTAKPSAETSTFPIQSFLRVGNPHPMWKQAKTENEVALLRFLKQYTTLPIPTVLDFSASRLSSPLGSQFILMNFIESDMDLDRYIEKENRRYKEGLSSKDQVLKCFIGLLEQGYGFVKQMLEVFLPQAHPFICGMKLDLSAGKITWDGASVGPCKTVSEFLATCLEHTLVHYQRRMEVEQHQQTKDLYQELLPCLFKVLKDIRKLGNEEPPQNRFYLRHADLHAGNINVLNGNIVGIFDWQHSRFEPLFEDSDELNLVKTWFEGNIQEELLRVLSEKEVELRVCYSLDKYRRKEWDRYQQYRRLCDYANNTWFYVQNWWSKSDQAGWKEHVRREGVCGLENLKGILLEMKYL